MNNMMSITEAAERAGVSTRTFLRWEANRPGWQVQGGKKILIK